MKRKSALTQIQRLQSIKVARPVRMVPFNKTNFFEILANLPYLSTCMSELLLNKHSTANKFFRYSLSASCGFLRIGGRLYLIFLLLSPADPSAHHPGKPQGLDLLLGAGENHSQIHAALQGPPEVAPSQCRCATNEMDEFIRADGTPTCSPPRNTLKSSSPPRSSPVGAFGLTCGMNSMIRDCWSCCKFSVRRYSGDEKSRSARRMQTAGFSPPPLPFGSPFNGFISSLFGINEPLF